MDLLHFCALFIVQFVAHKIGDYPLQSDADAANKAKSFKHRFRHCLIYSLVTFCFVVPLVSYTVAAIIFLGTFVEHMIVDTRKPVIWWKTFFEEKIMRNKWFVIEELPFFVLIEIDQTFHLLRILIISLAVSYYI